MNLEKSIYTGLKWMFSFFVGVMGIASVVLIFIAVIFRSSAFTSLMDKTDMPFGPSTLELVNSPLFISSLLINFILYGILFFFVRSFFKNLEMENIFVSSNVSMAKKISFIMIILSVTSCIPDLMTTFQGITNDGSYLDLTYLVGAAIVWALAKILERANTIVEESELTI